MILEAGPVSSLGCEFFGGYPFWVCFKGSQKEQLLFLECPYFETYLFGFASCWERNKFQPWMEHEMTFLVMPSKPNFEGRRCFKGKLRASLGTNHSWIPSGARFIPMPCLAFSRQASTFCRDLFVRLRVDRSVFCESLDPEITMVLVHSFWVGALLPPILVFSAFSKGAAKGVVVQLLCSPIWHPAESCISWLTCWLSCNKSSTGYFCHSD